MSSPLMPDQIRALQAAHARLRGGEAAAALALVDALPPPALAAPEARHLRALILAAAGRPEDARRDYEAALAAAPGHAGIWTDYARLLERLRAGEAALAAFARAVALRPDAADPLVELGLAALRLGRRDGAAAALARATQLAPRDARGWAAQGLLARADGDPERAAGHFRRALALDPRDHRSRHNLALCLRELDRAEDALAEIEAALAGGLALPETATTRAHLLADLGRHDEAVAQYRAVIAAAPAHLDAQETLARLLPQLGRGAEALDGYRAALAALPESAPLWSSALATAKALSAFDRLLEWSEAGARRFGPLADFTIARAAALAGLGDARAAIGLLDDLVARAPDFHPGQLHLAHVLLAAGDAERAEAPALAATRLAPEDQSGWAYLTTIWRLRNDPREAWLADYDRLVMPIDLDLPAGGLAELAARLTALHVTREAPGDQSLRGGTQTRGNLFDRADPLLRDLAARIRRAVEARIAALPDDPGHPFLRRRGRGIVFQGSWSVRLRGSGFHVSHFHQQGWLSSALHVALPAEVAAGQGGAGAGPPGALTFGVPDPVLGIDLPPRRVEIPREGRLVVFPSYFWHGTVPFESDAPRLTVAFDALPG